MEVNEAMLDKFHMEWWNFMQYQWNWCYGQMNNSFKQYCQPVGQSMEELGIVVPQISENCTKSWNWMQDSSTCMYKLQ